MKYWRLWQMPPGYVLLAAIGVMSLILAVLTQLDPSREDASLLLVIIACLLIFAFLARLPSGHWHRRLLTELLYLSGSALMLVVGYGLIFFLEDRRIPDLLVDGRVVLTFGLLGLFSHSAVRIFARPYLVWEKMRRRRLVWEITHAQLRLVLFTMLMLFSILMISYLINNIYLGAQLSTALVTAFTLLIALGGFFGILTGVLLFVVVIPASVISYLTARQITRRLDALIQVTHTIRNANYHVRASIEGEDEIARLGAEFNAMLDQLDAARRDLETERDTVRNLLEARRRFFANVSHELRTPVATIRAYLEALKQPDTHPDDIAILEREALRLSHLIDDVFTLARADVDALQYNIQALEVGAVLERTSTAMRQQAWAAKKIEVVLEYQPQLPLVWADEERLEQVLYNLLRNAVRHTPQGGLIRVRACPEPVFVKIEVQDTGEGIKPDDLPYIWERFYRSVEARAGDSAGSGLGLALVKEMIEAMGGAVSVTSEPGYGSCFSISLRRVA